MARISQHRRIFRSRRMPIFNQGAEATKVLAVGNCQRFVEQISELLRDNHRISLLGGAQGRLQAAERLVLLKPDVIVIEANLDYELGGVDTAFALRSISPSTAFVLVSPFSDPERLAMVPRGLGLEWSYVLSEGGIEKDDLAAAISSAAWSIPYVDRRIDRTQLGRLQDRVEKAVEHVVRTPWRVRKDVSANGTSKPGYTKAEDWNGTVQRFRLPEDVANDDDQGNGS